MPRIVRITVMLHAIAIMFTVTAYALLKSDEVYDGWLGLREVWSKCDWQRIFS